MLSAVATQLVPVGQSPEVPAVAPVPETRLPLVPAIRIRTIVKDFYLCTYKFNFQNNLKVALNMLDLLQATHDVPPLHTPLPFLLPFPTEQPLSVLGLTMFPVLHT